MLNESVYINKKLYLFISTKAALFIYIFNKVFPFLKISIAFFFKSRDFVACNPCLNLVVVNINIILFMSILLFLILLLLLTIFMLLMIKFINHIIKFINVNNHINVNNNNV